MDEITTIFEQDRKEKSRMAQGAKHRATRTGRVGKVMMPADFLGKEYSRSSKAVSFSVEELLYMLQETPTLKQLLIEKLDVEYQNYRLAIERTTDAVAKILEKALQGVQEELDSIKNDLLQQKNQMQHLNYNLKGKGADRPSLSKPSQAGRKAGHKRSPAEMKEYVFCRIAQMEAASIEVNLENIMNVFPGITYYLYTLKLWTGSQEMLSEYHLRKDTPKELPKPEFVTAATGIDSQEDQINY